MDPQLLANVPADGEAPAGPPTTTEEALRYFWRLAEAKRHLLDLPALQQEWRQHGHDEDRLGLEVLLQLLSATMRDLASRKGPPLGQQQQQQQQQRREKAAAAAAVLAPETQEVLPRVNLMAGFGWRHTRYVLESWMVNAFE